MTIHQHWRRFQPGNVSAVQAVAMGRDDYEELRIGVVMNGGVSLAIWMGGVATEIDRLRRGVGAYGDILELTCTTPRVDVIAGTSAGGLNGALLATAIAHQDQPLEGARELWVNAASLTELLRSPFDPNPPSLMRGDEHFLRQLQRGFSDLCRKPRSDPTEHPMHLVMLTSSLQPISTGLADDFGSTIPDVTHLGEFTFRRGVSMDDDWEGSDTPLRLALGARSSASFPFAFEASFVPVGTSFPNRPDMRRNTNFRTSRYTVDGGALMNKPFRPALRAIYEQPAEAEVRRVLCYVVPDPGSPGGTQEEREEKILDDQPSITRTILDSLITMPRIESVAEELRDIRMHNDRVRALQRTRDRLLAFDLESLATQLFLAYISERAESSVQRILRHLDSGVFAKRLGSVRHQRSRIRDALLRARVLHLPGALPPPGETFDTTTWLWGVAPVEGASMHVLALLRDAQRLALLSDDIQLRADLREARRQIHAVRAELRKIRFQDAGFWEDEVEAMMAATDLDAWAHGAFERWKIAVDRALQDGAPKTDTFRVVASLANRISRTLVEHRPRIIEVCEVARIAGNPAGVTLRSRLDALAPDHREPQGDLALRVATTLRRLLSLDVVLTVFLQDAPECEQPLDLMMISGNTPNTIDSRTTVAEKLAGVQLGHFGAFYKASWRANDWMWGRLDGAARLAEVIVNPKRLSQLGLTADEAFDRIKEAAGSSEGADGGWDREGARAELAYLDDPTLPTPSSLRECARGVAHRIQLGILIEELPHVVAAINTDAADGADLDAAAIGLSAAYRTESKPLTPSQAVDLFKQCRVGTERITDDVGSDLFTRTVSTTAAVAVAAVSGNRSGLGPARSLIGALRTFVFACYLVAQSAARKSKTGFAASVILFASGAFIVTLRLASGDTPSGGITVFGGSLLLAGILVTGVRSGSPVGVPILLALTGVAAALPYLVLDDPSRPEGTDPLSGMAAWREVARPTLALVALIAIPTLVGWIGSAWRRWRRSKNLRTALRRPSQRSD